MNKKKLPRAIRPEATQTLDDESRAAMVAEMSEPWATLKEPTAGQKKKAAMDEAADVVDDTPAGRRAAAVKLVKRFAVWAGAGGLIPVPFVDMIAVSAVQYEMVRRISRVYDVPFSENRGKAIVAGFAGTVIPASSGIGAASLTKGVPLLGSLIGFVTVPTLAYGATYAMGMAFVQHFVSGGTLLDFNPPDYREFIKAGKPPKTARA
jgi:uncharacterized protein (DUF697 family)